jgi:hypothetical protein
VSYFKVLSTTILYVLVISPHRAICSPNPDSFVSFSCGATTQIGPRWPHCWFLNHTHNRQNSSERGISPSQRALPKQQTHVTTIHALSVIRTRDPCYQTAADLRVRPHGHRNQLPPSLLRLNNRKQASLYMSEVRSRQWCIRIIKTNEMHSFSTLYGKELYMFRTDLLSIIRSPNTVFTAIGICHTSYTVCLLARSGEHSLSSPPLATR